MQTSEPRKRLRINGQTIEAEPRETVLQAALRNGLPFPNSCRVGGCGTCKCRLEEGRVKELTETGYLLSADELAQNMILACQSVPRSDLCIEVKLDQRGVRGRVVNKELVTHDIARLTLRLERALDYRAGQFARLAMGGVSGVSRSYSFGAPPQDDGTIVFYVRKVPGGRLSSVIVDEEVTGREVTVTEPEGEMWLRPGDAPLLLIAGGSGLPPLLAMLKEALAAGVCRPVTLLFGAREERDLYAREEIAEVQRAWRGPFEFIPVLSAVAPASTWSGERGLVTDQLPGRVKEGAHAYLCGPPAMVDGAIERLVGQGVSRANIRFDRFTTSADVAKPAQATRPVLDVLHYLKFSLFHFVGLFSIAALLAGGRYTTGGLLGVLALYIVGDALGGDDTSTPAFKHPRVLTAQLWLGLPLLAAIVFVSMWTVCSGDPLGFGAAVHRWTGWHALAARDATTFGHHVSAWVLTGLMIGMVGTVTAHELTHRTWDRASMMIGRWLLAFSFDTSFAIEHVYGHHRYVSTIDDPATAPRGRNVYFHVVASTLRGNGSAWKIESARLRKKRLGVFSVHNAFLRGHLASLLLVATAFAMGGWKAAAFFTACALWGKALLEIVNYLEHYGMVRDPATPVQPRHSWNTNRRVSSWSMFNLTRHSHHHAQGEVPFHQLAPYPDAPMMINGYLTTIVIAMVPPLWHWLMTPKVLAWDRDFATAQERTLAARANALSGVGGLRR